VTSAREPVAASRALAAPVLPSSSALDRLSAYVQAAHAPNTLRGYDADWAHFARWCTRHQRPPLPAAPETVALYLVDLADGLVHGLDDGDPPEPPRAVATIARRLAGIGFVHREAGHPSPADHEGVRRTLRGIRRAASRAGAAPGKARPLGTEEVRLLVDDLPDTLAGRRDRAAVLLGYALALRAADLVALDVADLTPDPHGLRVRLRRGKSDQDGAGTTLALVRGRRTVTCPVRAAEAWLTAAGHTGGPLLRAVGRGGRVGTGQMATSSVYRLLRRAGARAGLDLTDLSPHSLRRGHITTAAKAGAPERQIARTSRHASLVVLRGYIDDAQVFNDPSGSYLGL